ncbi:MAG: serine protease [Clostridium sp.]|nr:serine protease [Acetatifactor muris]MCM1527370.1 serine protease [Bacteroides sp.]MCM1563566.1 serine protease [Clostridium sp.]
MKQNSGNSKWLFILAFAMIVSLLLPSGGNFSGGSDAGKGGSDAGPESAQSEGSGQDGVGLGGENSDGEGGFAAGREADQVTTVRIGVGDKGSDTWNVTGSGVIWEITDETLWIVTAGHVTEMAVSDPEGKISVDLGGEVTEECRLYPVSSGADLAFLRIDRANVPESVRDRLAAAETDKASYDALQPGDAVRASGFNEGNLLNCRGELTDSWIYVEDFAEYMILADCAVYSGMSGCGLYDGEGHLIGIVCGGNEAGELTAVPLHVAQAGFADL